MELSTEQKIIIEKAGDNDLSVNAVAGSGKTTTNLYIAKQYPEKRFLLITYNNKLKLETRRRVEEMKLDNIEVHSYHSFCVKYYDRRCYTDQGIYRVLNKECGGMFLYDVIVIDEIQDMTPLYFKLVKQILESCNNPRLLLFGDVKQSIYDFNKADSRFLIYSGELFGREFKKLSLSNSFRLTPAIADFINYVLFSRHMMTGASAEESRKPLYFIMNSFSRMYDKLLDKGINIENGTTFIIAPSLRSSKTPVRIFANELTKLGIPIYVPVSDEEKLKQEVLEGKIVFSSIHQAKGLEADNIIFYGFDESYFKYYKKDHDPYICPNEIYVACTRARNNLVIGHDYRHGYMPFVNEESVERYCELIKERTIRGRKSNDYDSKKSISVTDLVRHLPSDLIRSLMEKIYIKVIDRGECALPIISKIKQGNLVESVSEINGTAIPLYYDYMKRGSRSEIFNICDLLKIEDIDRDNIGIKDVLRISNFWCAYKSGYSFKTQQILDYDWFTEDDMNYCKEHLDAHINDGAEFEQKFETQAYGRGFKGYIDCIIDDVVWEFKCVSEIQPEHILQVLVYRWISKNNNPCRLINILTREVLEIDCNDIKDVIGELIHHKISSGKKISDEEFIENNSY